MDWGFLVTTVAATIFFTIGCFTVRWVRNSGHLQERACQICIASLAMASAVKAMSIYILIRALVPDIERSPLMPNSTVFLGCLAFGIAVTLGWLIWPGRNSLFSRQ